LDLLWRYSRTCAEYGEQVNSNRDGGIFFLAALVSTSSRTVTESYRAASFQGWSVMRKPDAEGSAGFDLSAL
jgi:hypothetical protein